MEYRNNHDTVDLDLIVHDIGKFLDDRAPNILKYNRVQTRHHSDAVEDLLHMRHKLASQAVLLRFVPIGRFVEIGACIVKKHQGEWVHFFNRASASALTTSHGVTLLGSA